MLFYSTVSITLTIVPNLLNGIKIYNRLYLILSRDLHKNVPSANNSATAATPPHCPKSNPNFHDITWNVEENNISSSTTWNIPCSISFPRYISCHIAKNLLPLGQCWVHLHTATPPPPPPLSASLKYANYEFYQMLSKHVYCWHLNAKCGGGGIWLNVHNKVFSFSATKAWIFWWYPN